MLLEIPLPLGVVGVRAALITWFTLTSGVKSQRQHRRAKPGLVARALCFAQALQAAVSAEPEPYAAYGYEAMTAALAAIGRAGQKDRGAIRAALLATHDLDGVLGPWGFTPTGDTTLAGMSVHQVRNGTWDDSTTEVIEAPP